MIDRLRVRIPAESAARIPSLELTFCAYSSSASVPPPGLPQWHVKDPDHSAKNVGGRLHLNTHTYDPTKSEWADYAVQASCGNISGNEFTRQGTLCHSRFSLMINHGIKSENGMHELIHTHTHTHTTHTKEQAWIDSSKIFTENPRMQGKNVATTSTK